MKLATPGHPHLTYCTNIHAGETWREVRANVAEKVAQVRARLAPEIPFGVGLRLSARAAEELCEPRELLEFKELLENAGMYVFTINGFPYGQFHGTRVKESVYLPDWRDDERVLYTERLATLLAELLPDGVDTGSVSTVPGAFRSTVTSRGDVDAMSTRMVAVAVRLDRLKRQTGKTIVLAVEPEPACHLETTEDAVRFFEDELFLGRGADEAVLRRHLTVCFDACHMAVAFESPKDALLALSGAGIAVGKIQISAGLEVDWTREGNTEAELAKFADEVYLHQVVARHGDGLSRYVDLPEALAARDPTDTLWRVHFHVPIFRDRLGHFANTQGYLRELLAIVRQRHVAPHLEVETYSWDVLPAEHRQDGLVADVSREMEWVMKELAP